MSDNTVITYEQFGFRKDKTITDAIFLLNNRINNTIKRNNRSLIVFLGSVEAFDLVNRSNLINKLRLIGCRVKTLNWFESYLSNRRQIVAVGVTLSDSCDLVCGVV